MRAAELLNSIPMELTDRLGRQTLVDYSVQRLRGRVMLELLLYGMLRSERLSTRVLEAFYNSPLFAAVSSKDPDHQVRHTSIAERLKTIPADYFAELVDWAYDTYMAEQRRDELTAHLYRVDSTMVRISSALVDWGMRVGRKPKDRPQQVQLKITLGMKGALPRRVDIHQEQAYLAEERALRELIEGSSHEEGQTVCFDMGLKSRATLVDFDGRGIRFITRGRKDLRYDEVGRHAAPPAEQDGLRFVRDSRVRLYRDGGERVEHDFRLIEAEVIDGGERLYFLTNIWELDAALVARIYRRRWDIEVLFRFLKQELNLNHLLSHSLNGIRVQIYVTLLLAILLSTYKSTNGLRGYKIAKLRFEEELLLHIIQLVNSGQLDLERLRVATPYNST